MSRRGLSAVRRALAPSSLPLGMLATVLLFLFAVQLLGTATNAAAPLLERALVRVVVSDASALGLGWLGAYLLANGSVVATLALSLFTVGLLSPSELFLMVAGSRLGAAAIVVFIGALDYFQKEQFSLARSTSMGLLTFLLTHSVYLPVTVLGYLALPALDGPFGAVSAGWDLRFGTLAFFDPVTAAIIHRIGPAPSLLLAFALLFGSMRLFDRLLDQVDTETLRQRLFTHFRRLWVSFAVGLFVTLVTTSVAFSLGVVVPLYNRGYIERDELIPYVLGANIGTLFDTLVVALLLESPTGVGVVLELLAVGTLVTLAVLVVHERYTGLVTAVHDRLLEDRRAIVAFVLSLLLGPLLLSLVPIVL